MQITHHFIKQNLFFIGKRCQSRASDCFITTYVMPTLICNELRHNALIALQFYYLILNKLKVYITLKNLIFCIVK